MQNSNYYLQGNVSNNTSKKKYFLQVVKLLMKHIIYLIGAAFSP
jgi:hypothetical protein